MKKYEVEIVGACDMLQNRLGKDILDEISKIPKKELENWELENWEKKLYSKEVDGETVLIFPEMVIHATLSNGCKKYKVPPPKTVGRTWTAYFKSCVLIPEHAVLENTEVIPFGTMVNGNPSSSKGSSKVYRIRPLIKRGWKTKLTILDVDNQLNKEDVEGIFKTAGLYVGICDWRPMYGRFDVIKVKETKIGE